MTHGIQNQKESKKMNECKSIKKRKNVTEINKVFNEINLAEFPLFLLSKTAEEGCHEFFYEDAITVAKGTSSEQAIRRTWRVTWEVNDGSGKAPVAPTTFVRKVFFTVLQQLAESNFTDSLSVFNSRSELLSKIHSNSSYNFNDEDFKLVDDAVFCLQNMFIVAEGSFYDIETKNHVLNRKIYSF